MHICLLDACRVVLVGDPQQLPATVLSREAQLMERSMFERLQLAGCPVTMLTVQYRMHASIREFPSRQFYNSQLTDRSAAAAAVGAFMNVDWIRGMQWSKLPVLGQDVGASLTHCYSTFFVWIL